MSTPQYILQPATFGVERTTKEAHIQNDAEVGKLKTSPLNSWFFLGGQPNFKPIPGEEVQSNAAAAVQDPAKKMYNSEKPSWLSWYPERPEQQLSEISDSTNLQTVPNESKHGTKRKNQDSVDMSSSRSKRRTSIDVADDDPVVEALSSTETEASKQDSSIEKEKEASELDRVVDELSKEREEEEKFEARLLNALQDHESATAS